MSIARHADDTLRSSKMSSVNEDEDTPLVADKPEADATLSPQSAFFATPIHLTSFCDLYFEGRVQVRAPLPAAATRGTSALHNHDDGHTSGLSKSWTLRVIILPILYATSNFLTRMFRQRDKHSVAHQRLERAFAVLTFVAITAMGTSLVVSMYAKANMACRVTLPYANTGNCCDCLCNINETWCGTSPTPVPGQLFSNGNTVGALYGYQSMVELIYFFSLFCVEAQLIIGILRGNYPMMVCVIIALMLHTARGLYLHFNDDAMMHMPTWYDVALDAVDAVSLASCAGLLVVAPFLRPGFRTLQFQQFGSLTTHQTILHNYNIMFATTLLELEAINVFYNQFATLTEMNSVLAGAMTLLWFADLLSCYAAYQYVRFERRWHCAIALVCKVVIAILWLPLMNHLVTCFNGFTSRGLLVNYQLSSSSFLGIDVGELQTFLYGTCDLSPLVSTGQLSVTFASLMVAFACRMVQVFYTAILAMEFGNNVVSALFFDVVGAKQKEGIPAPQGDTLD